MTVPHGTHFVCLLSQLADMEMALEVSTPPLVVDDNHLMKVFRLNWINASQTTKENWRWSAWNTQRRSTVEGLD